MKTIFNVPISIIILALSLVLLNAVQVYGQDETEPEPEKKKEKPVSEVFGSSLLIDGQTVIVPAKKTLQWDINHRFGQMDANGIKDLYGIYGASNIRMGVTYTVIDNLSIGFGTAKGNKIQDFSIKYAALRQTKSGSMPICLTYYGNVAIEAWENKDYEDNPTHRLSYFHSLMVARKFTDRITVQLAPTYTHLNVIDYTLIDSVTYEGMKHDNFGVHLSGRFKFNETGSFIFQYAQPLTPAKEVKANLGFGVEFNTGGHALQFFVSSVPTINYQRIETYNTSDFTKDGMYLGFNLTRLFEF